MFKYFVLPVLLGATVMTGIWFIFTSEFAVQLVVWLAYTFIGMIIAWGIGLYLMAMIELFIERLDNKAKMKSK